MSDRGQDYLRLVRIISSLLYAHDPEGMGLSVFAPLDEYDGIATRHTAELTKLESAEIAERLEGVYPNSPGLPEAITAAVELFQQRE